METRESQNQNQNQNQNPHAVLVPFPSTGHVNPLLQLAKILHARGFHVTFVHTESYHKWLIRAKGPESVSGSPGFRFETFSDGLPPPVREDIRRPTPLVCESLAKNGFAPFRALLKKLNSDPDIPCVTCIVSDGVMTFTMQAAKELCVPEAQFWTASAIGLMGYYQYAELVQRGIVPFKDESYKTNGSLETPLDWVQGMKQVMRLRDIPFYCRTTNPQDIMLNYMIEQTQNCKSSSGVIINTFDDLEGDVLEALASIYPRIYTVGPLFRQLGREGLEKGPDMANLSLWRANTEYLDWLQERETGSVVYVNFGTVYIIKEQELQELARALAACGYHFLWILGPNIEMGDSTTLPKGFVEDTSERGMIASWCDQQKVLAHPSIGMFITHAGWNSLLESISCGVPVLCWPVGGEQTTNSTQVCNLWGNGMQIEEKNKKSEEIVGLIKKMMKGKKCEEVRGKALEWKKKVEQVTSIGGSSCDGLERLIEEVLLGRH